MPSRPDKPSQEPRRPWQGRRAPGWTIPLTEPTWKPTWRWTALRSLRQQPSSACPGAQAAEATVAPAVLVDSGLERRLVEIRPEAGQKHELGIGRLPGQEVRHPLLARGANDQIR